MDKKLAVPSKGVEHFLKNAGCHQLLMQQGVLSTSEVCTLNSTGSNPKLLMHQKEAEHCTENMAVILQYK